MESLLKSLHHNRLDISIILDKTKSCGWWKFKLYRVYYSMMYMIYILKDLHEYIYVNVCLIYNFAPKKMKYFVIIQKLWWLIQPLNHYLKILLCLCSLHKLVLKYTMVTEAIIFWYFNADPYSSKYFKSDPENINFNIIYKNLQSCINRNIVVFIYT